MTHNQGTAQPVSPPGATAVSRPYQHLEMPVKTFGGS